MGDIERYMGSKVPSLRDALEDRFPQPTWLSEAGQLDRRNEGKHLVAMRQIGRDIERRVAETYAEVTNELMQLDGEARLLTETKFRLERAQKESAVLAGEDPELRSKFAVLDDDFFQHRRSRIVFGLDKS